MILALLVACGAHSKESDSETCWPMTFNTYPVICKITGVYPLLCVQGDECWYEAGGNRWFWGCGQSADIGPAQVKVFDYCGGFVTDTGA